MSADVASSAPPSAAAAQPAQPAAAQPAAAPAAAHEGDLVAGNVPKGLKARSSSAAGQAGGLKSYGSATEGGSRSRNGSVDGERKKGLGARGDSFAKDKHASRPTPIIPIPVESEPRQVVDIPLHGKDHAVLKRGSTLADLEQVRQQLFDPNAIRERKTAHYSTMSIEMLCAHLKTDRLRGLTGAEAASRLKEFGPNELPREEPEPMWKMFLAQFSDILVIMLCVSAIIAIGLGEYAASAVIIVIVMANAILGVVQERRAGAELEALALKSLVEQTAEVIRDGQQVSINPANVVPGDLLLLELGKKIVADVRIVDAAGVSTNEMPLTGESEPVKKRVHIEENESKQKGLGAPRRSFQPSLPAIDEPAKPNAAPAPAADNKEQKDKPHGDDHSKKTLTEPNMAYMGCTLVEGNGRGIVVKTGEQTAMGVIAKMIEEADDDLSPLQAKLRDLGKKLGIASLSISILVFIIGISTLRGVDKGPGTQPAWLQMLLVAISLTVAAVPEGLPACVTITLAIGMGRMAKKRALIRNLHSVETLGSASVICTDKTGTLTCGVMTMVRLWMGGGLFKITGTGYVPVGQVLPAGVDEKNQDSLAQAQQWLLQRKNMHRLPLLLGALGSNAVLQEEEKKNDPGVKQWVAKGNMTDRALVVAGQKIGFDKATIQNLFHRLKENPFDSARKLQSVVFDAKNMDPEIMPKTAFCAAVKGAPNILVKKCTHILPFRGAAGAAVDRNCHIPRPITEADVAEIEAANKALSDQAYRMIAVAYKPIDDSSAEPSFEADAVEKDLVFVGLCGIVDPEREEVPPSIRRAASAGIRTVMITGDHVDTARAIAANCSILPHNNANPLKAVDCDAIRHLGEAERELEHKLEDWEKEKPKTPEEERQRERAAEELTRTQARLDEITAVADVYARAKPIDKITIVRSLQRQGHVCSMTGDGVNDAPALAQANIGVAMGITGTDVAKAAAAMVLEDDNFVSIVHAIEEGRTIYNNIQKFVFYLLSTNVSEVFTILVCFLIGYPSPLRPIQILWLNLTTDGAPAIALAVEDAEPGVMEQGPRPKTEPLLEKVMVTGIIIQNLTLTFMCVITFAVGMKWNTEVWLKDDYNNDDPIDSTAIKRSRTMCILYIVLAELLRAYGSRSLRVSILSLGVFSNRWMQWAVGTALVATIILAVTPGLQDVFGMADLSGREWGFVLGLCFVPLVVDELTKVVYRATGFGERPKHVMKEDHPASSTSRSNAPIELNDIKAQ